MCANLSDERVDRGHDEAERYHEHAVEFAEAIEAGRRGSRWAKGMRAAVLRSVKRIEECPGPPLLYGLLVVILGAQGRGSRQRVDDGRGRSPALVISVFGEHVPFARGDGLAVR
jgi:hypothetical protein